MYLILRIIRSFVLRAMFLFSRPHHPENFLAVVWCNVLEHVLQNNSC